MKVKVYNLEGKEVTPLEVSEAIFGVAKNDDLVKQVAVSLYANRRQVLSDTKNRGERAGSGIKPWRQKGTGRARVGSVRNPAWKKGGVAFGPTSDRNFEKKINKKMNKKAVTVVLSEKLRQDEIKVLEKMEVSEKKTKSVAKVLKNLGLSGSILIAYLDKEKEWRLLSRNIAKAKNILVDQLNVWEMLNSKNIVLSQDSIKFLESKYSKKTE